MFGQVRGQVAYLLELLAALTTLVVDERANLRRFVYALKSSRYDLTKRLLSLKLTTLNDMPGGRSPLISTVGALRLRRPHWLLIGSARMLSGSAWLPVLSTFVKLIWQHRIVSRSRGWVRAVQESAV